MEPLLDTDGIVSLLIDGAKATLDSAEAEMMPMCVHQLEDGSLTVLALAIDMSDSYSLASAMAKGIRGPLHLLALSCDAYYERGGEEEIAARRAERGTVLSQRFAAGDDSVFEAVSSMVLFADGRFVQVSQPYVRNHDTGTLTWDELQVNRIPDSDAEGRIPDVMRTVMTATKMVETFIASENN